MSNEPVRKPRMVIFALNAAMRAYPDQRVMQVIVNALGADPFNVEDLAAADALYAYANSAAALPGRQS